MAPTNDTTIIANAYKVVADHEEGPPSSATAFVPSALDGVRRTVRGDFAEIPEAQGLTWNDNFFDQDEDVVAVFDFDYPLMESFQTQVGWATLAGTVVYPPLLAIAVLGLTPCCLRNNVRWSVNAQHVAITRDGIRYVRDKRRTCWGLPCTDAGKKSKTVPFDKITDCDITEPAGNTCLCIKNVLSTVNVDTASSNSEHRELHIAGLKDPHSFKKLVWAMKRSQNAAATGFASAVPAALEMTERKTDPANDAVATLLREIRDELRQNNEILQKIKAPSPDTPRPTAEAESSEFV